MPFKNREDFNRYRKEYRNKKKEEGCCVRCFRPLIEEYVSKVCANCQEYHTQHQRMYRNFF